MHGALVTLLGLPAFALLGLAAATLLTRDARQAPRLYAWASVPQAAIAVGLGVLNGTPELFALAAAILIVKGGLAPRLLVRVWPAGELGAYRLSGRIGSPAAMALAMGLAVVAYRVAPFVARPDVSVAFGASLAAALIGLVAPVVRHELSAQATALLQAEAGVTAAALLLVGDSPASADAVSLAELAALSLALGVLLARVARLHGSADARHLSELRG